MMRLEHVCLVGLSSILAGVRVVKRSGPAPPSLEGLCNQEGVQELVSTLFSRLGSDCDAYASMYSPDATYYHQHSGFSEKTAGLKSACEGYGDFCFPGGESKCSFLTQAPILTAVSGSQCRVLAPYIWSQFPADVSNVEPHTGWEYMELTLSGDQWQIEKFAEIETTYTFPFDWATPEAKVEDMEARTVTLLAATANGDSHPADECNSSPAPFLTAFFASKSAATDTYYRQQGSAVATAAGGICQMVVPFAAQVGRTIKSGYQLLVLNPQPDSDSDATKYAVTREQEFVFEQFAAP